MPSWCDTCYWAIEAVYGRSNFSYMLRMVETAEVLLFSGYCCAAAAMIFEELVAFSIVIAPLISLFFDRLWTPGVENPDIVIEFFSRELLPSLDLPASFASLKKPLVLVPKAGVSTSFLR